MRNYKNMYAGYVSMATVSNDEKITGVIGIAAIAVFIIGLLIALVTDNIPAGSEAMSDLYPMTAFMAGSVIAGILGAIFGLLITIKKTESKFFIGRVRGVLMIAAAAALIILGLTEGNDWVVYLFVILIILAATADVFYNWVADQKIHMVLSMILKLCMALIGILSLTETENFAYGFAFVVFVALWFGLVAIMRFAPVVEPEPVKGKKAKGNETKKKNEPAPRPYPVKKEEPAKKSTAEKSAPKKAESKPAPKKAEPKPEPKKAEPKPEPKKAEPKPEPKKEEQQPKLKVMSSREAAAARNARKKEEPAEEPDEEPAADVEIGRLEPAPVPAAEVEADAGTYTDQEEEGFDEFAEVEAETPDALLRRATWNKGLRCRRDYGEFQIPIAYVRAKVAVYVQPEFHEDDALRDEEIRAAGWTVFRYLESEISDGKDQAEEISKAVKENLKAERAAKKKKSKK
jgi:colicin import membrane protein